MYSMSLPNADNPFEGASAPQLNVIDEHEMQTLSGDDTATMNVTQGFIVGSVPSTQDITSGMGRGAQLASMVEHGVRASPLRTLGSIGEAGAIHSRHNSSEQSQKPMGSVPENQWQVIADVVKQLRQVASSLSGASQGTFNVSSNTPQPTVQTPDWSKINLVLKSDIKEPPYFRGDSTDRCTVTEWQEMMQAYLIKKGCSVPEQGREILDRLMGRAKDIARIGIRNNPLINISRDPDAIYSML